MRGTGPIDAVRRAAIAAWSRVVTGRPRLTIAATVAIAALCAAYAGLTLGFRSDRDALIDPGLPWQQRYAAFKAQFPRWDDAVVVVDVGGDAQRADAAAFLDALEASLAEDPWVEAVTAGFATDEAPAGLLLSQPLERVRAAAAELSRAGPVFASPSLGHLVGLSALGAGAMNDAQREELAGLLERTALAGRGGGALLGEIPAVQRLTSPSGSLALVLVSLKDEGNATVDNRSAAVSALRERLGRLLAEPRFAGIDAGVTGVPVLEADETRQSMRDSARASALGAGLVAALALAAYRRVMVPLLVVGGLLLGLAASFGWAALAVGHLQVLSVVFMVMLVGLGTDMTVQLISRLEVTLPGHATTADAVRESFAAVGPGVITGTLTTAAAFAATGLTDFAGVAELGVIAAGGVVVCTLLTLAFFPAALCLFPGRAPLRVRPGGVTRPFLGGRLNWVDRRPWAAVALWLGLLAVCAPLALRVRYDTDLLKLLPDNVESVAWERRLSADDEQSVWHAVVVASSEEAAGLTARLRALPEVSDVGAAGLLFPAEEEAKRSALRAIPEPTLAEGEAIDPRPAASALAPRAAADGASALAAAAERVAGMDDAAVARAQASYAAERAALAERVRAVRNAEPARAEDLPPALREQIVGMDGSLLLRVFPRHAPGAAGSILAPERLEPFVSAVEAVAPGVTGPVVQIRESAAVITRANLMAGALAALVILVALSIDFRHPGDVACALTPVLAGVAGLLGALGLLGIDLNFANTIVAPLIVGLGVTAGVNAVHRWRLQPMDPPAGLAGGAGRAITLTMATTIIGFLSMLTAEHRGIRSLGLVMSLGLGFVLAATLFLLPAVLRLRTRGLYHSRPEGFSSSRTPAGASNSRAIRTEP